MTDPAYKTFEWKMHTRGLSARHVVDVLPDGFYANLVNWEARQEGALSTRFGRIAITHDGTNNTPLADTDIHTLGRLKGLSQVYRFAGAGTNLYRRVGDTVGAYTPINGASSLSGDRFSMTEYRPDFSAFPYIFFADQDQMLKDNGALAATQLWGIHRPTILPTMEVQDPEKTDIELFEVDSGFTYDNFTTPTIDTKVNTTLGTVVSLGGTPAVVEVTPASMTDIKVGGVLEIDGGGGDDEDVIVLSRTETKFKAKFQNDHTAADTVVNKTLRGTIAANTVATVTKIGALDLSQVGSFDTEDEDKIHLYIKVSVARNIQEIKLMFDTGNDAFDENYFVKSISRPRFQPLIDGDVTASEVFGSGIYDRASSSVDYEQTGEEESSAAARRAAGDSVRDLLPEDDERLEQVRPTELLSGDNQWTRVTFRRGDFLKVGSAGTPGFDWEDVGAFRVEITTDIGSVNVSLDDLYLSGGSGPDVFAGVPYDYRYTYYNINTGAESNPSETFISDSHVSPRRQPVSSTWTASGDTQVTHVRLYRRGGVLPTGWKLVAEVPKATTTFIDQQPDRSIFLNKPLEIDNDPPVTSTLNEPVDTTFPDNIQPGSRTVTPASMDDIFPNQTLLIDEEGDQERVWVTSTTGSTFTAFFQRAHDGSSTAIRVRADTRTGKNLHLSAQGYERMWLAGDSDNPHYLYYSKKQRPESFPPQNFIEIGVPSDPIMAVVNYKGQIFVFTLSRIHRIISPGNSTPQRFDTSAKHGLHANFGWVEAEGSIFYISYDGVYRFNGDSSDYMSESTEWLFTGQNLGPVTAMDRAQIGGTLFEYDKNFVYISYVDTSGNRRRIKWDTTYERWINDDVPATAIFFEKDVFNLVIARANGMIYIDQTGDFDGNGRSAGVQQIDAFTAILQTRSDDQGLLKNDKVYNELSLDIDTQGLNVTVDLLFDNAATVVNLGTVSTANRSQASLNIGSGLGQTSKNVALRLTAVIDAENNVVTLFETHLRAVVEAEKRKSFDSYWSKYGSDEFKIIKQGWFEYVASDAGGISFDVYLEGSATPEFSFTLPQSTTRTAVRVRFPANKAKIWRWVATSSSDFQLYDESHLEVKPVLTGKGYGKVKLAA